MRLYVFKRPTQVQMIGRLYLYFIVSLLTNRTFQPFPLLSYSLQWRHNGCDGVSNHQLHHCLPNRLFRRRSKKAPKPHLTGLCAGNSLMSGELPAQVSSNTESVSIWWRHHVPWFCVCGGSTVIFCQLLHIWIPETLGIRVNSYKLCHLWCMWIVGYIKNAFVCTHITQHHYHQKVDLFESVKIFCLRLGIIFFVIYGVVFYQHIHFSFDDCGYIFTTWGPFWLWAQSMRNDLTL